MKENNRVFIRVAMLMGVFLVLIILLYFVRDISKTALWALDQANLISKRPVVVIFNQKTQQIEQVDQQILKDWLAREYVMSRETIDHSTEQQRYEKVFKISSVNLAKDFYNSYRNDNASSPLLKSKEENYIKHIKIIGTSFIDDNKVEVEFYSIILDSNSNRQIQKNKQKALVTFDKNTKTYSEYYRYVSNPFDFLVSEYVVLNNNTSSSMLKLSKQILSKAIDLR